MRKLLLVLISLIIIVSFNNKHTAFINEVVYNGNNLRVSIDGNIVKEMPKEKGYYLSYYVCDNKDTKVSWDSEELELNISNKKIDSCNIYFESMPYLSGMKSGDYVKYLNDVYRILYNRSGYSYITSINGMAISLNNINNMLCDKKFVSNADCKNIHNITVNDIKKVVGKNIEYDVQSIKYGYGNDLIDIDEYLISDNDELYYWDSINRLISKASGNNYHVRPVIKLDSSVRVISGHGTLESPYVLSSDYALLNKNGDKSSVSIGSTLGKYMCINVDNSVCSKYIPFKDTYEIDLSMAHNIYVYFKDENNKKIASFNLEV